MLSVVLQTAAPIASWLTGIRVLEFGASISAKIFIICNAEFSFNFCFKAITEDG